MALKCEHCHKGKVAGHAVSHAKNRTQRFFKPNLQKLKAIVNGAVTRVKLCTRCIKRLKKDGTIGRFQLVKPVIKDEKKEVREVRKVEKVVKVEKGEKAQKAVPTLDIASIVGKKE